jgi:putative transcriptional regulator
MKREQFRELLESVREAGQILRGERDPSRSFELDIPRVADVRAQSGPSRDEFAGLLGVSPSTLRHWEQGRRRPKGPARVLIQIAADRPEVLAEAARRSRRLDLPTKGNGAPAGTRAARKDEA